MPLGRFLKKNAGLLGLAGGLLGGGPLLTMGLTALGGAISNSGSGGVPQLDQDPQSFEPGAMNLLNRSYASATGPVNFRNLRRQAGRSGMGVLQNDLMQSNAIRGAGRNAAGLGLLQGASMNLRMGEGILNEAGLETARNRDRAAGLAGQIAGFQQNAIGMANSNAMANQGVQLDQYNSRQSFNDNLLGLAGNPDFHEMYGRGQRPRYTQMEPTYNNYG